MDHTIANTPEKKFYWRLVSIIKPLAKIIYPYTVTGLENIPDGAALICANHSNYIDPVYIALCLGKARYIKFMAKKELLEKPVLGWILRRLGVFPVDREASDIEAIRTAMKSLKSGDRVMMFPEGTRVSETGAAEAKTGAVRIAAKMRVPVVPVYVPRDKGVFRRVCIRFGEAYYISAATHEEYVLASSELMDKIEALGEHGGGPDV